MIPSIKWGVENYLGLFGLGVSFVASSYLLYYWFKHHKRQAPIFLWAISGVLFYVFLIPFISVNFHGTIVIAEMFSFFILTIPLVFLGWVLVYWCIVQMKSAATGIRSTKLTIFLTLWVLASFIFYAFRFSSEEYGKFLSIIGILAFFITIHVLILHALWKWFKAERRPRNMWVGMGILFIAGAIILSIVRYLMILNDLVQLPQTFWFLAIASFDMVFILRSMVIILLAIGFIMVYRHYLFKPVNKSSYNRQKEKK